MPGKCAHLVEGVAESCIAQCPIDTFQGIFLVQLFRDGIVYILEGDLRQLIGLLQASFVSVDAALIKKVARGPNCERLRTRARPRRCSSYLSEGGGR